jgi:probable H4MPT-linked C1 transfer pathway protein
MSPPTSPSWLALDVGGAKLKAAHTDGPVLSLPFAVWKHPDRLAHALADLAGRLAPFDALALTLTAELCDCFRSKADGVLHVLEAAHALAGPRPLRVWGTDGRFHHPDAIAREPLLAAASNWLALAAWAARRHPSGAGLLIDVGSTTTDLIPLLDGRPTPLGRTDTARLRSGELVYAGTRRTPVCALATELAPSGEPVGLCAELFATTLDIYLLLGHLPDDPLDLDTADGRPATREFARERLARMIGADGATFSEADALALAHAADDALMNRLLQSSRKVARAVGTLDTVIVSGSGEPLADRLARRLLDDPAGARIVRLSEVWDAPSSASACARALAALAGFETC